MAEDQSKREESPEQDLERSAILVVVQFPGMVVIGKCNGDMMFKPRLVGRGKEGGYMLLPMSFTPQDPMYIGSAFCFSYQPGVGDPVRALYLKETTGIDVTTKKIIVPGDAKRS